MRRPQDSFRNRPAAARSFYVTQGQPEELDGLSSSLLKEPVARLLEKMAELERTNVEQREEIARLKGLKGRPDIKPSGMDKSTEPSRSGMQGKRPGRGQVRPRVVVEDRIIKAAVPAGSCFKGYETYQVQELVLSVHAVRYLREGWITADGQTIVAPLPDGTQGHFGPTLRRFVLMQYHQVQAALPHLAALLQSVGLSISDREIQRLLTEKQDDFLDETRDVLRAGLRTSPWISVDDTGARHKAKNGHCTQIGNNRFSWFGTRATKSRLNFLDLLRAEHTDFVSNDAAFDYMRTRAVPVMLIASLAAQPERDLADQAGWSAQLDWLGFTGLTTTPEPADGFAGHRFASRPDPVQIATDGAIWGSIHAHDFLRDALVLSDDAGQFAIGQTHCAGSMPNGWCTNWTPSPTRIAPPSRRCGSRFGTSMLISRRRRPTPTNAAVSCGSTASSAAAPALPPWIAFWRAGTRQGRVVDGAGAARNPATHQWFRGRYPLPGHSPQDQRRDAPRSGARLPRCRAIGCGGRCGRRDTSGSCGATSASGIACKPCRITAEPLPDGVGLLAVARLESPHSIRDRPG